MAERKSYAEKLLDPKWQRKRLEVLDRDEWTCFWCQSKKKTLHVHHSYYLPNRDPWDYPDFAYVTFCEPCHKRATGRIAEILSSLGMLQEWEYEDVYGYVLSHRMAEVPEDRVEVGGDMMFGLCAYFRVPGYMIDEALDADGKISAEELYIISRRIRDEASAVSSTPNSSPLDDTLCYV